MDVCLPLEFLRLTTENMTESDTVCTDWLGAEAWVSGVPQRAASARRSERADDPTWQIG
jgi:hypothetical protein